MKHYPTKASSPTTLVSFAQLDDVQLVKQTCAGTQAAFQTLVERYQDKIFRLVSRFARDPLDVEDIVQDIFMKAFRRLDSFTFQASFYTWLYRIALNTSTDAVHRRRRNPVQAVEDPGEWKQDHEGERGTPDSEILAEELRAATRKVLDTLPDKFRTMLVLREYEQLTYDEMAQVLGISIGTVESRLFRARARFRDKMNKMFPELFAR